MRPGATPIERDRHAQDVRDDLGSDQCAARDGAAEVIPTGPPKTPRGGSPAFATRPDDGDELTPDLQNKVPTV